MFKLRVVGRGQYLFTIKDTASITLGRNGQPHRILLPPFSFPSEYKPDDEHEAVAVVYEDMLMLWVDGKLVQAVRDETLPSGRINGDTAIPEVSFKDLEHGELTEPPSAELIAAAFTAPTGVAPPSSPSAGEAAPSPTVDALAPKGTPTSSPAPMPQSVTAKWLAEQIPQWQTAFAKEVSGPFEKGVSDLKKQYLPVIEAQLAAATKAAKLEEAVAFRTERQRMVGNGEVPPDDEPATPESLKSLRATYRAAFAKLDAERLAKTKSVHARYDAILEQSQTALTQRQRLDEALEIKAQREALNRMWLNRSPQTGQAPAGPLPPTPSSQPASPTPSGSATAPKLKTREVAERLLAMGAIFSHGPTLNPNVDSSESGRAVNEATRVEKSDQIPRGRFTITQVEFLGNQAGIMSSRNGAWEILESLPDLVTVRFFSDMEAVDVAIEKLNACRNLRTISIKNVSSFTGATLGALAVLPELTSFNVFGCSSFRGDEGGRALAQLRRLQAISLISLPLTPSGLAAIAELPALERLTLGQVPKLASANLTVLSKVKALRSLDLIHFAVFDSDATKAIASCSGLEGLRFHGSTPVTDDSLASLVSLTKLQRLNLDKIATPINGVGFAQWPVRPFMSQMDLRSSGGVSDDGLRAVVASFPKLEVLRITADAKSLTATGLAELPKLRQLERLTIEGNAVTDARLAHIGRCDSLTHLHIGMAKVTDAGMSSVSKFGSLVELTWFNPPVTDVAVKTYRKLRALAAFRLGNESETSVEVEQKLKAALPRMNIVR